MLIDEATIIVRAGSGGNGASSFKRNAQTAKGGPDGGNGGNGGNIYIQGINDITALAEFTHKKKIIAEDGIKGGKQNLYGRNGKDTIIFLPTGTFVSDLKTNETFEITNITDKILIAKGGKGGRGNNEFKSATNQTPYYAEKGEMGEEKSLFLELKLVADIGLIGLPNSGKSSLLSVLTRAHPKIGDYPFTTLEPNLGVMPARNASQSDAGGNGLVITDIPGLIEGASTGKGLGDKFLKHIEKTKVLIHCIDSASEDILKSYNVIRNELKNHNSALLEKQEIVVLTKTDLINNDLLKEYIEKISSVSKNVTSVTILEDSSIENFKKYILKTVDNIT